MNDHEFARAYDEHHGLLYFWVLNWTHNKERAEDICSRAFAKAWQHRATLRGHFKTWVFAIAKRELMADHRRDVLVKWEPIPEPDEWGNGEISDPRDFTKELEQWYEWQRAANAAMLCNEAERRALAGALQGEKIRELAKRWQLPHGTVGRQLASAREKVRVLCRD